MQQGNEYIATGYHYVLTDSSQFEFSTVRSKELEIDSRKPREEWRQRFFQVSLPVLKYYIKKEPKIQKALEEITFFPVDINQDDVRLLGKIPGISLPQAWKLFALRKERILDFYDIKLIGGKYFLAKHFICSNGKLPLISTKKNREEQLELF